MNNAWGGYERMLGRVIVGLATDRNVMNLSGRTVVAAALAEEYGLCDIDGRKPRPLTVADA